MNRFSNMIEGAFEKGDAVDPDFRRQVYETITALLKAKIANGENPSHGIGLLRELENAISNIEANYIQVKLDEKALLTSVRRERENNSRLPNYRLLGSLKKHTLALGTLMVLIVAIVTYYVLLSQMPQSTPILNTEDEDIAEISFLIGDNARESGSAKLITAAGILFIIDEAEGTDQYHQWLIENVEPRQEHYTTIVLGKEPQRASYMQLQIVYSGPGIGSVYYIYLLDLSSGKVSPKNKNNEPEFQMETRDDNWVLKVNSKSPALADKMQFIISPTIGKVKTGSIFLRKLRVLAK